MLFGVGFYSFTIGTLSSVLVNMDTRENILKYKLSILNDFSKETKLNTQLKEKIKKILVYNSQKNIFSWMDKQEIFNELPANLKCEVFFYLFFLDCEFDERRIFKGYFVFFEKR